MTRRRRFKLRRVDILFVVGMVIVIGEAARWRGPPNPSIIFAGLALMGLPVVARGEEKVRRGDDDEKK